MSEAKDLNAALAILNSPYFFRDLLLSLRRRGLVGERRNALALYITATTRLFDKPSNLLVKGESGSGKNFLTDSVLSLIPEDEIKLLTSSSSRAWNYRGSSLKNNVVYLKERNDESGPVHPMRLLVSEGKLIHSVTVRDGSEFRTEERVTEGPVSCISTTTKDRIEIDDETRHLSIWIDESATQTKKILRNQVIQKDRQELAEESGWQRAQKLLKGRADTPIALPDWFRELVDLVSVKETRVRRYFPAFLQACRAVCLIRTFARNPSTKAYVRKRLVRFSDFAIASAIFNPILAHSLDDAGGQEDDTRFAVEEISKRNGGRAVGAVEVAEHLGISEDKSYARLRDAVDARVIVRANPPEKANRKLYLPANISSFIPEPREVFKKVRNLPTKVRYFHPLLHVWMELESD